MALDILLREREEQKKPIRIGLIGAGVMGRMIALQLLTPVTGMRLVAIANRTTALAEQAYREGGAQAFVTAQTVGQVESAVEAGTPVLTENPLLLCEAKNIDAIIEATGAVEFGARVVLHALKHRKHVILVNAELDSTLGPILAVYAKKQGVVLTNVDGDEPGVAMNLLRYMQSLGFRPVGAGNLKGMIDPYRTPETQKSFAAQYQQNPRIVTSFADGTKLSMEETILANATGFHVGKRGMYGPQCAHVKEIADRLPKEQLLNGGLVDYALGAEPYTGAYVIMYEDQPQKMKHLRYLKMGEGPFYVFYTPYHLPHIQLPLSVARAVLDHDATTVPLGPPVCDVLTLAKKDMNPGELLDGVGGFTCYGVIDNAPVVQEGKYLPMGLSEGCRLKVGVKKDEPLTYEHVELPHDRVADRLRKEQNDVFSQTK